VSAAEPAVAERQRPALTLAVLTTAALAYALSQTMVAPALPDIQRTLSTSTTSVTWVLTVYLLSASIATPIVGRFGDMFGKERVLVYVLGAFAAGSLVCALSHSIGVLIAGRAIQGVAGAIFPLSFGIIRDEFPRDRVGTGIGLISATFGIGGAAGLVLSGIIVDNLSYEWLFWLSLIVTLPAMLATHLFVPESPVKSPARIDWGGAGLLSAALLCLLTGVSYGPQWGWSSARVLALFAAAVAVAIVWARYETRVAEPMVDMRMMRERAVWTTNLTGLLVGFGMFGSFILIPQLVQMPVRSGFGFGASVTEAGLFLLPSAGVMLVAGPLAGALGNRFGSRVTLVLGTGIATAAFALLAVAHDQRWEIYLSGALMGVGIGFSFAAMAILIVDAVPQEQVGVATGINSIMRTIGGSLGAQIAASIVATHVVARTGLPGESGFTEAFVLSAGVLVLACMAALAIPPRGRPPARASAAEPEVRHDGIGDGSQVAAGGARA
jgi:EmrB/QacA subfamily drug resistance transporter